MALAYIDEYGAHVPTYDQTLSAVKEVFRSVYGDDIYLEADSQDGQLCALLALGFQDCYELGLSVYNSYSPHSAQGAGLSGMVKINGIRRHESSNSQVDLRMVGTAGTIINNGIASDQARQRWLLPAQVVIPAGGEVIVTATAEISGAIRAQAGAISTIATPTRGWQSVNNPDAATPGQPVETDYTLRLRQADSTALPALSTLESTVGAIASLDNVGRYKGYENDTNDNVNPDDVPLPPHSVAFVVEGGDAQQIGDTIAVKKTPGAYTYGTTNVISIDMYGVPNIIRFFRPTMAGVGAIVTIKPLRGYTAVTADTIKENLVTYLNNLGIGESVLLSKLYTPINEAGPLTGGARTFDVQSLLLARDGGTPAAANIDIAFNEVAETSLDNITVTVL